MTEAEPGQINIRRLEKKRFKTFIQTLGGIGCFDNLLGYEETCEKKWVIRKGMPWPIKVLEEGNYPFCILDNGEIYLSRRPRPYANINHPELVKGKPVVTAGILRWKDGAVDFVSNESGHYCPTVENLDGILLALRYWGVPISDKVVRSEWLHG